MSTNVNLIQLDKYDFIPLFIGPITTTANIIFSVFVNFSVLYLSVVFLQLAGVNVLDFDISFKDFSYLCLIYAIILSIIYFCSISINRGGYVGFAFSSFLFIIAAFLSLITSDENYLIRDSLIFSDDKYTVLFIYTLAICLIQVSFSIIASVLLFRLGRYPIFISAENAAGELNSRQVWFQMLGASMPMAFAINPITVALVMIGSIFRTLALFPLIAAPALLFVVDSEIFAQCIAPLPVHEVTVVFVKVCGSLVVDNSISSFPVYLLTLTIFFMLYVVFIKVAERVHVPFLRRRTQNDNRKPVLFLRSFSDERIRLRGTHLRGAFSRAFRSTSIEDLLANACMSFAPLVTLGKPGQKITPFGSYREYVDEDSWRKTVSQLIVGSRQIVIGLADTESIWWEVEKIFRANQESRTLFLFPPDCHKLQSQKEILLNLQQIAARKSSIPFRIDDGTLVPEDVSQIIGLFYDAERDTIHAFTSTEATPFAYRSVIRTFFQKEVLVDF